MVQKFEDAYVKVEVWGWYHNTLKNRGDLTALKKSLLTDCADVVNQIERHVDDITSVNVEEVYENVCEYCGAKWTEGPNSPHNGGCCDEDCKVFEATP